MNSPQKRHEGTKKRFRETVCWSSKASAFDDLVSRKMKDRGRKGFGPRSETQKLAVTYTGAGATGYGERTTEGERQTKTLSNYGLREGWIPSNETSRGMPVTQATTAE